MTLGSLFDGSGTCPLAAILCGITPIWASEIEKYPIAVTSTRLPDMKHLGDITKISGAEVEPVDIITFGSPCQDLSVAGKRAGLSDGERSSLFYEAIRIIGEMRDSTSNRYPRFAMWENVPGAFSSNQGNDFQAVLEAFCAIGGYTDAVSRPAKGKWIAAGQIVGDGFSVAWRTLDAQYWGLPQRRRRIFLVADFGGERAGEILFEREGLSWNSESGIEAGEDSAPDALGRANGSAGNGCLNPWDQQSGRVYDVHGAFPTLPARENSGLNRQGIVYPTIARTLAARYDSSPCVDRGQNIIAAFMGGQGAKAGGIGYSESISPTLKSVPSGGNTVPDVVYSLQGYGIDRADTTGCSGCGWRANESYTLNTVDRHAVAFDCRNLNLLPRSGTLQAKESGGHSLNYQNPVVYPAIAGTLTSANARNVETGERCNAVVFRNQTYEQYAQDDIAATLRARDQRDAANLCVMAHGQANAEIMRDICPTLNCNHEQTVASYDCRGWGIGTVTPAITGDHAGRVNDYCGVLVEKGKTRRYIIRRLTPLECCRLQGFPDRWMDGVEGSDSAKYKMWGNGMALPCVLYVMQGIAQVEKVHRNSTM